MEILSPPITLLTSDVAIAVNVSGTTAASKGRNAIVKAGVVPGAMLSSPGAVNATPGSLVSMPVVTAREKLVAAVDDASKCSLRCDAKESARKIHVRRICRDRETRTKCLTLSHVRYSTTKPCSPGESGNEEGR